MQKLQKLAPKEARPEGVTWSQLASRVGKACAAARTDGEPKGAARAAGAALLAAEAALHKALPAPPQEEGAESADEAMGLDEGGSVSEVCTTGHGM